MPSQRCVCSIYVYITHYAYARYASRHIPQFGRCHLQHWHSAFMASKQANTTGCILMLAAARVKRLLHLLFMSVITFCCTCHKLKSCNQDKWTDGVWAWAVPNWMLVRCGALPKTVRFHSHHLDYASTCCLWLLCSSSVYEHFRRRTMYDNVI